ncbi:MAG: prepilin peptidase [Planctomycetota bacterium]
MIALWVWLVFAFVMGACVGSFLNVVILRLPAGMSLIHPPSHDPATGKKLAAWENIPILSYLMLGARSRHSGGWISPQYPIVELLTGLMFVWVAWVYYGTALRPAFSHDGLAATWPVLLVHLALVAALVAATVIDARLYIIPLTITWFVAVVAVVVLPVATALGYPGHTTVIAFLSQTVGNATDLRPVSAVPLISDVGTYIAIGGLIGLVAANALLMLGVVPRSFDESRLEVLVDESAESVEDSGDADAEVETDSETDGDGTSEGDEAEESDEPAASVWGVAAWVAIGLSALTAAFLFVGMAVPKQTYPAAAPPAGWFTGISPAPGLWAIDGTTAGWLLLLAVAAAMAAWAALILVGVMADRADAAEVEAEVTSFPRPRREALRELLFIGFPIVGGLMGLALAIGQGMIGPGLTAGPAEAPMWAQALGGVVGGYLIGGGVVWVTRVLGTLAFGREAMGLGDVHLMAAAGAVVGAADATIAFFIAPFFGIAAALIGIGVTAIAKGRVRVIPYGPYLALAVVVMLAARVPVHRFLGIL